MWDIRKKGCIFGYKGHNSTVNSIRFSPDGQWIASGGDDNLVKVSNKYDYITQEATRRVIIFFFKLATI